MALRFSRLDRPAVRRLQPGEKLTEHGITAERLANGDIRYSVNVMVDGKRIHRVIGKESDGVTRTQTEAFIEKARTEAREGRFALPKGRKTALTFSRAADDYIARLEETGGKNIDAKKRHLARHLKPFFSDQRLESITTFTVDRFKKRRTDAGAKPSTINRDLATLSHLLAKAVEWDWIRSRPRCAKLPEGQGRLVALTNEQCDQIMTAALGSSDPYCWLFICFGLNTSMRHSEILRTRFDHIDFDNLRLHVPKAKAGQREQPITSELAAILQREREMRDDQNGWVFPSPRPSSSLTGHRHRIGKPFRQAVIAAGLDPGLVTPHAMRHTAITNLVQAGVDLPTIQEISGHKTLVMVRRYTHVHGPHIDRAIRAIGRGLPEQASNKPRDIATQKLHTTPKRSA